VIGDDLFGRPGGDMRIPEGVLRRAVRRAERLAQAGGEPTGLYHDVAQIRGRAEVARQIAQALQVRDEPLARQLIEDAEEQFDRDELIAAVREQARLAQMDALRAAEEAEPWASEPDYYDDAEWSP
jgi:hypothetical protein